MGDRREVMHYLVHVATAESLACSPKEYEFLRSSAAWYLREYHKDPGTPLLTNIASSVDSMLKANEGLQAKLAEAEEQWKDVSPSPYELE